MYSPNSAHVKLAARANVPLYTLIHGRKPANRKSLKPDKLSRTSLARFSAEFYSFWTLNKWKILRNLVIANVTKSLSAIHRVVTVNRKFRAAISAIYFARKLRVQNFHTLSGSHWKIGTALLAGALQHREERVRVCVCVSVFECEFWYYYYCYSAVDVEANFLCESVLVRWAVRNYSSAALFMLHSRLKVSVRCVYSAFKHL